MGTILSVIVVATLVLPVIAALAALRGDKSTPAFEAALHDPRARLLRHSGG